LSPRRTPVLYEWFFVGDLRDFLLVIYMDLPSRRVLIGLVFIIAVCGAVLLWEHGTSAAPMDFIERHLGFSPDDGDGSMEVMFLTVLVMIVTLVGFRWASASK
jgi:hypothetical protein